jgi:divinyl protochlorophyllide a 8-vinyl-reductase
VSAASSERAGRIGPNAILQLVVALREREGEGTVAAVLHRAGLTERLARPVGGLVPVAEVRALHAALQEVVGPEAARSFAAEAGRRTAVYLLAHRIPRLFQQLLARLPPRLRQSLLLAAIARHAWTLTGGGRFALLQSAPSRLSIEPCPLCPACGRDGLGCVCYAATFEALLRDLVDPRTGVEPAPCRAAGSRRCELRILRLSA